MTSPSTSTTAAPTSSTTATPGDATALPEIDAEVSVPDGDGPFPAVVLVHGGGWVTGNPGIMRPLADYLDGEGYLTVNTRYELASLDRPAYPAAVDDVACAVRYAAAHPDSDGTVTVIGHSAGAHIGALVALTGEDYTDGCAIEGSGVPERFVGLAGPYDVSRVGLVVAPFFGGSPQTEPDAWLSGNPQLLTDANPFLDSLIMYGDRDGLVPDEFAITFHDALVDSGSSSLLEKVEGARHSQMHDPAIVGGLIAAWLDR